LTSEYTKGIFGFVDITEPRALRALAHPLRLDLVELLGTGGAATAAECARKLGSTQASCSFHLRQLAKYGFVEEAPGSGDGRERPWQLTDVEQRWSTEAGAAAEQLERVFVGREADRMLGWLERATHEPESWRKAAFLGGMTLPLTAAELRAAGKQLRAVLDPYVARLGDRSAWPSEARLVRLLLSATPLGEADEPILDNTRDSIGKEMNDVGD
jgi:DNA-binding MarR family transcriptional regulator